MKIDSYIDKKIIKDLPKVIAVILIYTLLHVIFLYPPDNDSQSIEFFLVLTCVFFVLAISEEDNILFNILIAFITFLLLEFVSFYSDNVFSLIPAVIVMASIVFALMTVFFVFIQFSQQVAFDKSEENNNDEISYSDANKEKFNKMFTTMLLLTGISFILIIFEINIKNYISVNLSAILETIAFILVLIILPKYIDTNQK